MIISRLFSRIVFRHHFLRIFRDFVPLLVFKGPQRVSLGVPQDHNFQPKSRPLVPRGSPGGVRGAKSEHFGGHLGVFWG